MRPLAADPWSSAIAAGDVVRTAFATTHLPLHVGSGRLGGCFDAWGLQDRGELGGPGADADPTRVKTVLTHKDHWHRDGERDRLLPLARIAFARRPGRPQGWSQHLALLEGTLSTEACGPGWSYRIAVHTDPTAPDLLILVCTVDGAVPAIRLSPCLVRPGKTAGSCDPIEAGAAGWTARVRVLGADSVLAWRAASRRGACRFTTEADGAQLAWDGPGEHVVALAAGSWERRTEILAQLDGLPERPVRAAAAWRARWRSGGWIAVPDRRIQALWARSLFWQLCGNDGSDRVPAPPCGLTGLAWQFCFPQDVSFIHPALLRAGHHGIVAGWVEHWLRLLPEQEAWTRAIYRRCPDGAPAAGAGWAMSTPIAPGAPVPQPGVSNPLGFQLHNAWYPARMAWDLARHRGDDAWTRERAWPLIRSAARFFASIATRRPDGRWSIHAIPSAGQDEFDGFDQPDYLCALYAARAALTTALRAAGRLGVADAETACWAGILADGLAFHRLRTIGGLFAASPRYADGSGLGRQKHPCQFQPLAFCPLPGIDAPEAAAAFARRDELCERSGEWPRFGWGWTLPAGMLAATRLGRAPELAELCSAAELERQCGPELVCFQESTHPHHGSWYFTTSHGLFLQAVQDALLDDTWGALRAGYGLPAAWADAAHGGLRTAPEG